MFNLFSKIDENQFEPKGYNNNKKMNFFMVILINNT